MPTISIHFFYPLAADRTAVGNGIMLGVLHGAMADPQTHVTLSAVQPRPAASHAHTINTK